MFALAGCATPQEVGLTETGTPRYERIAIDYQLDRDRGSLIASALPPPPPSPIQTTSASVDAGAGNAPPWKSAQLHVAYPHPQLGAAHAQVTLTLSHKSLSSDATAADEPPAGVVRIGGLSAGADGATTASNHTSGTSEVRELDLPKTELDLLLIDLAQSGFFDDQTRPNGTAELEISIDEGGTAKTWTTEPRLDDLLKRAQCYGRLEGTPQVRHDHIADAGWSI